MAALCQSLLRLRDPQSGVDRGAHVRKSISRDDIGRAFQLRVQLQQARRRRCGIAKLKAQFDGRRQMRGRFATSR